MTRKKLSSTAIKYFKRKQESREHWKFLCENSNTVGSFEYGSEQRQCIGRLCKAWK
jgi:hypothetical protein